MSIVRQLLTANDIRGEKRTSNVNSGQHRKEARSRTCLGVFRRQASAFRPPPRTRAGSNKIARSSSKTPSTAMPSRRNGSSSSQTKGYTINARSAKGQQTTKRMSQRKNFATLSPSSATRESKSRERPRQEIPIRVYDRGASLVHLWRDFLFSEPENAGNWYSNGTRCGAWTHPWDDPRAGGGSHDGRVSTWCRPCSLGHALDGFDALWSGANGSNNLPRCLISPISGRHCRELHPFTSSDEHRSRDGT